MRATCIFCLTLGTGMLARADFSYTTTTKTSGGMMAAAAGQGRATKTYLKGQKMKVDSGNSVLIMDFDAQTITHIDPAQKTYRVSKFSDVAETLGKGGMDVNIDIKETGQHKVINGYNASEAVMTMDIDSPQAKQNGMKMRMEMEIWISPDVPGAQEMRAFYQRNAARFPWSQLAGSGQGGAGMQKGIVELRRKMAEMKGVPVLQVMKMGASGNEAQMAQMQQGMAQARAQLEEMQRQGKLPPQMQEQLKRMTAASAGGSMFETTLESSNFSTSSIPDSEFAIPPGYQQTEK